MSEILKITKKWYSDIADLRQKYQRVIFMRDNAGDTKSQDIIDFTESIWVMYGFSTPCKQWQNGLIKSALNSVMRLACTVVAESGFRGRFWFKAAATGVDTVISDSECRRDRPGFGCDAVYKKLRRILYYRV
jgi:hypothetical protein